MVNTIFHGILSEIIDRIIFKVKKCQRRPLDTTMYVEGRGCVESRSVYNALAIDRDGRKDLIGMYVSQSEGANFRLSILIDLKSRKLQDVSAACINNPRGSFEAISGIFLKVEIQPCIVHQILKYAAPPRTGKTSLKTLNMSIRQQIRNSPRKNCCLLREPDTPWC